MHTILSGMERGRERGGRKEGEKERKGDWRGREGIKTVLLLQRMQSSFPSIQVVELTYSCVPPGTGYSTLPSSLQGHVQSPTHIHK